MRDQRRRNSSSADPFAGSFLAESPSARFHPSDTHVTHPTGRFKASLGAITAAARIGSSVSNLVAGAIGVAAGSDAAFMTLGALACAGFRYAVAVPDTAPAKREIAQN